MVEYNGSRHPAYNNGPIIIFKEFIDHWDYMGETKSILDKGKTILSSFNNKKKKKIK